MVNDIRIQLVILMYLLGCLSLMIYNVIVIYRKRSSDKAMRNNINKWIRIIQQQLPFNIGILILNYKHEKHLLKSLTRIENLIAFSNALNYFKLEHRTYIFDDYMGMLAQSKVFSTLAVAYKVKKNEERAYFAYFISQYPQLATNTEGICTDMVNAMISYIDDSDIYCRTNVLKALCRVGDTHGIINVLQSFSDKSNFIHHRLLAEELFNFTGDKEVLALYLWGKYKMWNDNVMLGVVTFITMFSDGFKNAFLPALQNKFTNADIRLAIIRYYKEYKFDSALPVLIEYLNQTENYDFAMEAASALSAYPGYDTTHALISALQSDNWHVQYSAASSLVALGEYSEDFINDLTSGNALQIAQYMLEHTKDKNDMNVREVII